MDECEKNGAAYVIQDDFFRVPDEIDRPTEISERNFRRFFGNRKSKDNSSDVYYGFYQALVDFIQTKSHESLDKFLTFYENHKHKDMLNKAFGYGSSLFQNKRGDRPAVKDFLKNENTDLFTSQDGLRGINSILYRRFEQSKTVDAIREYSDTTIRIFKAMGLISFDNGYVELVCCDLCQCVFDKDVIKSHIMGGASKSKYTDSVIIMPVSNAELMCLMERKSEYNQIIRQVRSLFLKDIPRQSFNRNWRDEFISQL